MQMNKCLFVIPARGGSKGVPGKNIKLLGGRPLIYYTLDAACAVAPEKDICVSTDSDDIIAAVAAYGLRVPFKRPAALAQDTSGTYVVLLHALDHYLALGRMFETLVLLQPTSPFRTGIHIREALRLFDSAQDDMVVSAKLTKANPYYTLFEETPDGYLRHSKEGSFTRRQDCPKIYEYNGAVYVINVNRLREKPPAQFSRVKKYLMSEEDSVDIDSPVDWLIAEAILRKRGKR